LRGGKYAKHWKKIVGGETRHVWRRLGQWVGVQILEKEGKTGDTGQNGSLEYYFIQNALNEM